MRELTVFFLQILLCDILLILQDVIVITLLQGRTPLLGMFYRSRLGLTIYGGSAIIGTSRAGNIVFQQNPWIDVLDVCFNINEIEIPRTRSVISVP